jgi:hypothetical protein
MSTGYSANIVRALPPTANINSASGVWSVESASQQVGAGAWPVASTGADPYFENVSLLLTGDGTNGGQNNTFLDSSSNNFSISRVGSVTQGSFSPYGAGWSNYFDGTGDYLSIASGINLGTGDFTIEAFVYVTNATYSSNPCIFASAGSAAQSRVALQISTSGLLEIALRNSDGTNAATYSASAGTQITANTWTHVAAIRISSVLYLYVNGVLVNTPAAGTQNISTNTSSLVGAATTTTQFFFGNISNLRIVAGTGVYTTTFTPPATPLQPVVNTSLLTCQIQRFADNSVNNYTVTRSGNASVQPFNPFGNLVLTNQAYSAYFDGTGDYLTVPTNAALDFGTGDFTIEMWVNFSALSTSRMLLDRWASGNGGSWQIYWRATGTSISFLVGASTVLLQDPSGSNIVANTWNHVAVTRSGSTNRLFINGTQVASATNSTSLTSTLPLAVGTQVTTLTNYFQGYISNVRIVKGTALYTANFTPSTTPLTAVSGTSLLICNSRTFVDGSANPLTVNSFGDTAPRTFSPFIPTYTVSSYSAASLGGSGYFPGGTSYLSGPSSAIPINNFGTGPFTVEFWYYGPGSSSFYLNSGVNTSMAIYIASSNNRIVWQDRQAFNDSISVTNSDTFNRWDHYAVCRSGTTVRLFRNGVQIGSTTNSYSYSGATTLLLGTDQLNAVTPSYTVGYVADLRISNAALYTSPFVPPNAPLPTPASITFQTKFTNGQIIDSAIQCVAETAGNAQISTSVVKYGTGSMYNPANTTGAGIKATNGGTGTITGNFTIEWWAYHTNLNTGSNHVMLGPWGINGSPLLVRVDNGSTYQIYMANASRLSVSAATAGILATTWQHYAITRSGSDCKAFVNGIQVGSTWTMSDSLDFSIVSVFSENAGVSLAADQMPGYIDDLRITRGIARYTANFTPPNAAFPTF